MEKEELISRLELDGEQLRYTDDDGESHVIADYREYCEPMNDYDKNLELIGSELIKQLILNGYSFDEIYSFNSRDLKDRLGDMEIWSKDVQQKLPYMEAFNCVSQSYDASYSLSPVDFDELPEHVLEELKDYFNESECDRDFDNFRDDVDDFIHESSFQYILDEHEGYARDEIHQEIHKLAERRIEYRSHPFEVNDIDFSQITNPNVVKDLVSMTYEYDSSRKILCELSPELILECQGYFDSEVIDDYFYWNKFEELVEDHSLRNSREWFLSEYNGEKGEGKAGRMTIRLASKELLEDEEFLLNFHKVNPNAYEFYPATVRDDEKFVLAILKQIESQDWGVLAPEFLRNTLLRNTVVDSSERIRDIIDGNDPIKALSSVLLNEKLSNELSKDKATKLLDHISSSTLEEAPKKATRQKI